MVTEQLAFSSSSMKFVLAASAFSSSIEALGFPSYTVALRARYVAVFMFCYVFAFIGNFGILARQRSQLLPFVFVLVALPATAQAQRRMAGYREQRARAAEAPAEPEPAHSAADRGEMNIVTHPIPPPSRRR